MHSKENPIRQGLFACYFINNSVFFESFGFTYQFLTAHLLARTYIH